MQKIPLSLVQPGMILAKPVARPDGMVVAAPGTELSESLVSRFKNMGVENVVVEGAPVDMEGGGDTAFDVRFERLDHLFRKYESDKWMSQIKRLLRHFFRMKAAQQAAAIAAAKAAVEARQQAEAEARRKKIEGDGEGEGERA